MILIKEDSVMVHFSGVISISGMLYVLFDTTVTGTDMDSLPPVLLEVRRHLVQASFWMWFCPKLLLLTQASFKIVDVFYSSCIF
jgi:hypothetical protein